MSWCLFGSHGIDLKTFEECALWGTVMVATWLEGISERSASYCSGHALCILRMLPFLRLTFRLSCPELIWLYDSLWFSCYIEEVSVLHY